MKLTSTVYILFFCLGSIQPLMTLLNPGTIIPYLANIISLLTSYSFVEQLNRTWYLNNHKLHLVLMQVDKHHQTMWGCQTTGLNHVIVCSLFCLPLTRYDHRMILVLIFTYKLLTLLDIICHMGVIIALIDQLKVCIHWKIIMKENKTKKQRKYHGLGSLNVLDMKKRK